MKPFFEPQHEKVFIDRRKWYLEFKPHFHRHIELAYLKSGHSNVTVDGETYLLSSGEFFLSFPNQIHSYSGRAEQEKIMMLISPDIVRNYRHTFYNFLPENNICKIDKNLEMLLEMFLEEFKTASDEVRAGYTQAIIAKALAKLTLVPVKDDRSNVLKSVIRYCRDNFKEKITLEQVANELNISKFYLSHIFADKINISFTDYINSLRVEEAIELLEDSSLSSSEIADKCGFNTVRTFNRAFKKCNNMTPREYRKRPL